MITTTLIIIAIALTVAIAAALIYASTQPDTFRVIRSILIAAPAASYSVTPSLSAWANAATVRGAIWLLK
jgi:hypothetical protein